MEKLLIHVDVFFANDSLKISDFKNMYSVKIKPCAKKINAQNLSHVSHVNP